MIKKILTDEYFYIACLSAILLALIIASGPGLPLALQILRAVFGLLYVLFIPGYCLQAFAMPSRAELDGKERLALSFGLSLALIPALALILDRLPWGITLASVTVGLSLVILLFSFLARFRRDRLPESERFLLLKEIKYLSAWRSLERSYRVVYLLAGLALLITGLTAVSILTTPKPAERMTEFYLLGPGGKAESYPRGGSADQSLTVTLGIRNLEGVAASYRVEARDALGQVGRAGPFQLETGASLEQPFLFTPLQTGEDVEVTFSLFRDDQPEPYRSLRLWLNVKPSS